MQIDIFPKCAPCNTTGKQKMFISNFCREEELKVSHWKGFMNRFDRLAFAEAAAAMWSLHLAAVVTSSGLLFSRASRVNESFIFCLTAVTKIYN